MASCAIRLKFIGPLAYAYHQVYLISNSQEADNASKQSHNNSLGRIGDGEFVVGM